MSEGLRQKLLFLYLADTDLYSRVIAWSFFDGATNKRPDAEQTKPPYSSAVDAMRDGWRVIQVSPVQAPAAGREFAVDYFTNEIILEKMEMTSHD